jgi:hypothetical protein
MAGDVRRWEAMVFDVCLAMSQYETLCIAVPLCPHELSTSTSRRRKMRRKRKMRRRCKRRRRKMGRRRTIRKCKTKRRRKVRRRRKMRTPKIGRHTITGRTLKRHKVRRCEIRTRKNTRRRGIGRGKIKRGCKIKRRRKMR